MITAILAEMKAVIKERISKLETVEYTGSIWTTSLETIADYFNSNFYKAD
jgi:hypothetical protein